MSLIDGESANATTFIAVGGGADWHQVESGILRSVVGDGLEQDANGEVLSPRLGLEVSKRCAVNLLQIQIYTL